MTIYYIERYKFLNRKGIVGKYFDEWVFTYDKKQKSEILITFNYPNKK